MNLYMYEILEDYQFAETEAEREEIFSSFSKLIWENPNTRRLVDKPITFRIKPKLLHTEIGQIFSSYTSISRTVCPSTTKDTDFASLIRQKANNLYTHFFDGSVCSRKEYLELLRLPKNLYFQWQASLQKEEITWTLSAQELAQTLDHTLAQAQLLKETSAREKMTLSWEEFMHITDGYFRRLFEHYKPLEEYQDSEKLVLHAGAWNEDNYCIRYFCNGLDGYFKNYQKKYYGLYNASSGRGITYGRCACGNLFLQNRQHNRRLCDACRRQARNGSYSRYNQKRKSSSQTETALPHS